MSEQGRFRLHDIGDISTLQNKLRRDELAGRENHNCRYRIDTCDIAQQNPACRQAAHGEVDDPIEIVKLAGGSFSDDPDHYDDENVEQKRVRGNLHNPLSI